MKKKNLILTGGIRHNFDENTNAISKILNEAGFENKIEENLNKGFELIAKEDFDLVTVMALQWQMNNSPKYTPYKQRWGFKTSKKIKTIFEKYINSGGGLFGFHTACLCFDDWPEWKKILGGAWKWGSSYHPPNSPVKVFRTKTKHNITEKINSFTLNDEIYSNLSTENSINVLMEAKLIDGNDLQPVIWTNKYGLGKIAYDGLGHDKDSIENPVHSEIIKKCALWASK